MRITYHPATAGEVVEAATFYESKLPGLGADFIAEMDRTVSALAELPELHAKVQGGIRCCMLKRFPYGVYYRHEGDEVRILVIKHHSRRPGYGLDRT